MVRLALVLVAVLGGLVAATSPARAQDATAEVLFRDGDRLMGAGQVAEACAAFEASNRVEARAGTLIRLGDCREKNRQLASAWSAYADALSRAKDPGKKTVAAGKVRALEPRLSTITVRVAQPVAQLAIARDGVAIDAALWGRSLPIDGGTYTIRATADGFTAWEVEVTVPDERGAIAVEVPGLTAAPAPTVAPSRAVPMRATPPDPGMSSRRKAAIGVGVGGVVALGAGVALGVQARALEADAATLCPDVMCVRAGEANQTLARGRTRAQLANLGYGVGGAAIVAGAILWLIGGSPAREGGVAIVPTGPGAAVVGRF